MKYFLYFLLRGAPNYKRGKVQQIQVSFILTVFGIQKIEKL